MSLNLELRSDAAKTEFLARLAKTLTICARDTYEIGTENVVDSRTLRGYNELLHGVSGAVVSHLTGSEGYSLESVVEMVRLFGINHGRAREMNWALRYALRQVQA
jgi:hypothetical protein